MTIRDRMEAIRALHGGVLYPEAVVADAADPSSPLHASFEWDDTEAAAAFRLHQARQLIRAAVTILRSNDGGAVKVRAYTSQHSVSGAGGGYRATAEVMGDEATAAAALRRFNADIDALLAKYTAFAALAPQIAALRNAVSETASAETEAA